METIHENNKLSDHASSFFNHLRDYLERPVYFYGSILRTDYIDGKSDIDVVIFTDNESSTISQLSAFLHIPKRKFKRIITTMPNPSELNLIYGHKVGYYDEENSLKVEISIYNEKYKREILATHLSKSVLPTHASLLLWILKILFYHLQFISLDTYRFFKHTTLSVLIGIPETDFVKL